MSRFWYTRTTMKELEPDFLCFEHFSPEHFLYLGVTILIMVAAVYLFKKAPAEKHQKLIQLTAILLILDEVAKQVGSFATGQWEWDFLPLHLCSINIFVCFYNAFKKNSETLSSDLLYAVCIPGASVALLMPTWNNLPIWNYMGLHSQTVHMLLILYPVFLIAAGFRPNIRNLPKVLLIVIAEAVPIYFLNKVLGTNFFFINGTDGNPLLEVLVSILGEKIYFIGFIPIVAVIWVLMFLPWAIIEKKEKAIK